MQEIEEELLSLPITSAKRKFDEDVGKVEKNNFRLGVWNGIFYNLGCSFISRTTVLPSFLSHLTGSSALIGIVSTFQDVGWYLPQLPASAMIQHKAQKMPMYRNSAVIRIISFFALAIFTLFITDNSVMLTLSVLCIFIFYMGSGFGGLVFMELFAKAIRPEKRSAFLGIRMAVGGILSAIFGAVLIPYLLNEFNFPYNYGYIFLIGALITGVGLLLMALMREPRDLHRTVERSFKEQFKTAITLLRTDHRFRYYVKTRLLLGLFPLGLPFLFLFAKNKLGFSSVEIGLFIVSECLGLVISNYFWLKISVSQSNRTVLLLSSLVAILIPVMIIGYSIWDLPREGFSIIFAIAAAVDSGYTIGGMSYVVEVIPQKDRTTYMALYNTLLAFPLLLSFPAGILLDHFGFVALYGILLFFAVLAVIFVAKLENIKSGVAV